jgi:hypothetical protein
MPHDARSDATVPVRERGPDTLPLGFIALGLAILSALMAWSYFYSFLTYLVAPIALGLGVVCRGDERTRTLGTATVLLAAAALVAATLMLWTVGGSLS